MGVTLLASWAVQDDLRSGKLVELLPQWRIDSDLEPRDISFVRIPELSRSKQLRSFVVYFTHKFGKPPYSIAVAEPLIRAGKIKPIAVTGTRRPPSLAGVPTVAGFALKRIRRSSSFASGPCV